jgi:hypothetical protein
MSICWSFVLYSIFATPLMLRTRIRDPKIRWKCHGFGSYFRELGKNLGVKNTYLLRIRIRNPVPI